MIEIVDKKFLKKRVTVWFPENGYVTKQHCDVCCYVGVNQLHDSNNPKVLFRSLITDLTVSEDELLGEIHRSTKKEIRRSKKDNFMFKHFSSLDLLNDSEILNRFSDMYMKNYELKGMPLYDPRDELIRAAKYNAVIMTAMFFNSEPLAYGVYLTDYKNVRSWISTSSFRIFDDNESKRLVGRAKKRLLYESMLYFKNMGIESYDWGGVSSFDEPNGIDQLKMSFGGKPITYYDETVLMSWKYKLSHKMKELLTRK